MRDETEWIETVEASMNKIVGADKQKILSATGESLEMTLQQSSEVTRSVASKSIVGFLASSL